MISKELFEKFLGDGHLAYPWNVEGGDLFGSDGKILICLHAGHGLEFESYCMTPPNVTRILTPVKKLPFVPHKLSEVELKEEKCSVCDGTGQTEEEECDECDGTGEKECRTCGSDIDCDECDGTGYVSTAGPCSNCDATGKRFMNTIIGGIHFGGLLLHRLKQLQDCVLCINSIDRQPQQFLFDGGYGLIMPLASW